MKARKNLIEGEDYYINEKGYYVFLEKYHLERGVCCGNKCLHCPYNHVNVEENKTKLNIK